MLHDPSIVLLGGVKTSNKQVSQYNEDPSTFKAGVAVRLKNDGTLSLAKDDGRWIGVSLGKNLSNVASGIAVLRKGLGVPVLVTEGYEPVIGEKVYFNDSTGLADDPTAVDGDEQSIVTVSAATYVSELLTGIDEDGNEVDVALIDMPGGL